MKRFNIYPAKVILTSALMMALGYQASVKLAHHSKFATSGSSDMASTETVSSEITGSGTARASVSYFKSGDKTIAMIPIVTEGKFCETCGSQPVMLDIDFDKNKNNVMALNTALIAKLNSGAIPGALPAEAPIAPAVAPAPVTPATVSKDAKDFARLQKSLMACDHGFGVSDTNQCAADDFLYQLSGKKISPEIAMKFFTTNLEGRLIAQLNDFTYDSVEKSRNNSELATFIYDKLLTNLPSEYNGIRERVLFAGANAVHQSALKYQGLLEQASRNNNDPSLKAKAAEQASRMYDLNRTLSGMSNPDIGVSLQRAVAANDILLKDARAIYENDYNVPVSQVIHAADQWNRLSIVGGRPQTPITLGAATIPASLSYPNLFKVAGTQGSVSIDLPGGPATTIDGASRLPISDVRTLPPVDGPATTIAGASQPSGTLINAPPARPADAQTSGGMIFGKEEPVTAATQAERARVRQGFYRTN